MGGSRAYEGDPGLTRGVFRVCCWQPEACPKQAPGASGLRVGDEGANGTGVTAGPEVCVAGSHHCCREGDVTLWGSEKALQPREASIRMSQEFPTP